MTKLLRSKIIRRPIFTLGLGILFICLVGLGLIGIITSWFTKNSPGSGSPHIIIQSNLPLKSRWEFNADDPITFPPYISNGIVFIKTSISESRLSVQSKSKLIALDALTGRKLWEIQLEGLFEDIKPTITQNVVVVPTRSQLFLEGLSLDSGRAIWEIGPNNPADYIRGLTHDEAHIFVGAGIDPFRLFAVDPLSGKLQWIQSNLPPRSLIKIVAHDGKLYALFTNGIYVLDPETGKIIGGSRVELMSFDTPSEQGGILFMNSREGIDAIELVSGQRIWRFSPACINENWDENFGTVRRFLMAPGPIGDSIYVTGGCQSIFALDAASGMQRWRFDHKGTSTVSNFVRIQNLGYALFSDGSVRAIDLAEGTEAGRLETGSPTTRWEVSGQGLANYDETLLVTFGDRVLHAFAK